MNFKGYLRKDGLVGIRNYIAVISVVGCVNEPARRIADGIESAKPFLHHQGCCQLSPDLETITRTLSGIGMNPNVEAVLLVSLGCESISAEKIQEIINLHKPTALIRLQELGGITNTVKEGIKKVKILLNKIQQDRETFNINRLTIGIKCGASDATSGLASNPAVGQAVNILIEKGATVIFGETTEVIGAEHVLSKRAENKEVGEKIIEKVRIIERKANMCGVDMRGGQPTAGNIRGGITTIEEKSLGAIVKSGNYQIKDVLEFGEKPAGPGLYFMDSPGREMEFLTGVVSGGSQVILFSTGVGAVLVVGIGCETHSAELIAKRIQESKKPVEFITLENERTVEKLYSKGVSIVKDFVEYSSRLLREEVDLSNITIGIKCGGSDTTSGIAGNIVVGLITDNIIGASGSAIFTETPEIIGAEHILAQRVLQKNDAKKIIKSVKETENKILKMGVDVRNSEPTPGNILGGLTTLEEKSLGAIAKAGSSQIHSVLEWGEQPKGKGLFFMDGPSHTTELFSGCASAGCQILLFSRGGGLPARLPLFPGHAGKYPIMPIVKLTGNPKDFTSYGISETTDYYVGNIIDGKETKEEAADRILKDLLKIFSGEKLVLSETLTEYIEPLNFYTTGPLL